MARFLQWSDLHREMSDAEFPHPTAECPAGSVDAILVAGDLNARGKHLDDLLSIHLEWQVPVLMVHGNHEGYNSILDNLRAEEMARLAEIQAEGHDIRVLHRESTIIGDTRILGATLWTDFEIQGQRDQMMAGAQYLMRDYSKVARIGADGKPVSLRPEDTAAWHAQDRDWIFSEIERPFDGPNLVMTHHPAVPEVLAPESEKGVYAPSYVSDLREKILAARIDVWVSGHTHWARRGYLQGAHGPIAFTANMMGYKHQKTNFEPYRIIDSNQPCLGLEEIEITEAELRGLPPASGILERIRDREPEF